MSQKTIANSLLLTAAMGGVLVAVATQTTLLSNKPQEARERCYGIARAGKNECGTSKHGCAMQATRDGDAEEWLMLPKDTCTRIAGGKLHGPR